MRLLAVVMAVALGTGSASAAEPVARTFTAPVDRVWTATETVLKHLGWDVDKADRSIGFITTDSRRLEGDDFGVYAKGTRHRLQIVIKTAGDNRTTVTVERSVFKRERILWMDKDEPVTTTDTTVENHVLDSIGKAL